jgi:predicted enzyme related to lactoylglutathione lyase
VSRSSILNVTFDCSDAEFMARFWSEVTRWPRSKVEMPGNPFWVVASPDGDASPHLVFVEVPEPKRTKNRVHLDLLPQDGLQDQEIARLESSGARIVDDRRGVNPGGWVVMADPEGNEFCVEGGE